MVLRIAKRARRNQRTRRQYKGHQAATRYHFSLRNGTERREARPVRDLGSCHRKRPAIRLSISQRRLSLQRRFPLWFRPFREATHRELSQPEGLHANRQLPHGPSRWSRLHGRRLSRKRWSSTNDGIRRSHLVRLHGLGLPRLLY